MIDTPTRAHEYIFLLTKSPRYFYDADAVREPHAETCWSDAVNREMHSSDNPHTGRPDDDGETHRKSGGRGQAAFTVNKRNYNPAGRNKRTVWTADLEIPRGIDEVDKDVILRGDVTDQLSMIPDEAVHCVVTSPPYWGLRDYGTDGQLGLESTPEEYITRMVAVFREVRRVLRADGTLWMNMGDCYAQAGGHMRTAEELVTHEVWKKAHPGQSVPAGWGERGDRAANTAVSGLKPKDLVGMPWRLALALQADGWYLRSDIIWSKPNPMPESVTDRPTKAHEYIFLMSKQARYFYDADAVRETTGNEATWDEYAGADGHQSPSGDLETGVNSGFGSKADVFTHPAGRNKRTVWTIATQPMPEAHFATFPEKLIDPCIRAGTSEHGVCADCGAPWVRVVDVTYTDAHRGMVGNQKKVVTDDMVMQAGREGDKRLDKHTKTVGWEAGCNCGGEITHATVLDPFMGAGTVALVSKKLNRYYIGIELNQEYIDIANNRLQQVSLFLGV